MVALKLDPMYQLWFLCKHKVFKGKGYSEEKVSYTFWVIITVGQTNALFITLMNIEAKTEKLGLSLYFSVKSVMQSFVSVTSFFSFTFNLSFSVLNSMFIRVIFFRIPLLFKSILSAQSSWYLHSKLTGWWKGYFLGIK